MAFLRNNTIGASVQCFAVSVAGIAAFAILPSIANAGADNHVTSGAKCVHTDPAQYTSWNRIGGGLWFSGSATETRRVNCPGVRERTSSFFAGARIVVGPSVNATTCTLRARTIDTAAVSTWAHDDILLGSGGTQTIRWSPGSSVLPVAVDASIFFRCTLPESDAIERYAIDESDFEGAADAQAFMGTDCHFGAETHTQQTRNGYLRNTQTTAPTTNVAVCAPTHERSLSGSSWIQSASMVVDSNVPINFCFLEVDFPNGRSSYTWDDAINLSSGHIQIRWSPGAGFIQASPDGDVYIKCPLQRGMTIYNYFLDE